MSETRMRHASAIGLLCANGLWRVMRLPAAGRAVVRALGSDDETTRTMAGMLLVKAGDRSVPLVRDTLRRGENLALALTVLGDIGTPDEVSQIERFTRDPDPEVARAASSALAVLRLRQQ